MIERSVLRATSVRTYMFIAIGCTVLGMLFFSFLHYSNTGNLPSFGNQGRQFLVAIAITNLLGLIIFLLDQLLDRVLHWENNFLLRFISGLLTHMVVVLLFFTTIGSSFLKLNREEISKIAILFIISVFIYEIFYGLFYSYRYYAVTQAEQLRSERWQLELQFESLKSQISPHYLFNCLNTVSSLLYKDARVAEEFIRRMADTFRYVLSHQTRKLVTLREELDFVKSYYFLLQVRYEYNLQLEINIPSGILDTLIPPMTLQLLVENAVKHNAISREQPLMVYIHTKDNTSLVITNTKTSPLTPISSFRVGLENIRRRYGFFSQQKIVIRNDDKFLVQLPVLTPAET